MTRHPEQWLALVEQRTEAFWSSHPIALFHQVGDLVPVELSLARDWEVLFCPKVPRQYFAAWERASERPRTRRGDPQNAHSLNQPRMLAHPHRLSARFLSTMSASTLSQPRCSRVTLVPPSMASKRISTSVSPIVWPASRYKNTRRSPGSHTTMRPHSKPSPVASSYTSSQRPPTPGSMRIPVARSELFQLMGPGLHHRPISSVKIAKAVAGSTATSTVAVTMSVDLMSAFLSGYARCHHQKKKQDGAQRYRLDGYWADW